MMTVESLFVATWAAGIVEGASLLTYSQKQPGNKQIGPLIFVPAILYGTLSLPLSLIGAAPGVALIGSLPFAPKMEAVEHALLHPSFVSINPPAAPTPPTNEEPIELQVAQKDRQRVNRLREENRIRHLGTTIHRTTKLSSAVEVSPPPAPSSSGGPASVATRSRFLATLEGRALLPTPLAEAMRRTRFLFAGAGIVTFILSYQAKQEDCKRMDAEEELNRKRNGKDSSGIRNLVARSQRGAAVRWCTSMQQVSGMNKTEVVTIPLCMNFADTARSEEVYWNPGRTLQEWKAIPISSDWLLRTTSSRLLLLEVDLAPSSVTGYFQTKTSQNDLFSESTLVLDALIATARQRGVITSESQAVKVVVSPSKPALPLSPHDIFVDSNHRLGIEVSTMLERMHREVDSDTVKASVIRADSEMIIEENALATIPTGGIKAIPHDAFSLLMNEYIIAADMIGSSIRQAAARYIALLTAIRDDTSQSSRVVHVLSDEKNLMNFLQTSLRDWKIVWYDANNEFDVDLYLKSGAAISVVCCGKSLTTNALLAAASQTMSNDTRVLVLLTRPTEFVPLQVSTICIQDVHDTIFAHIRDLLAEGKSPEEVQEIVQHTRQSLREF